MTDRRISEPRHCDRSQEKPRQGSHATRLPCWLTGDDQVIWCRPTAGAIASGGEQWRDRRRCDHDRLFASGPGHRVARWRNDDSSFDVHAACRNSLWQRRCGRFGRIPNSLRPLLMSAAKKPAMTALPDIGRNRQGVARTATRSRRPRPRDRALSGKAADIVIPFAGRRGCAWSRAVAQHRDQRARKRQASSVKPFRAPAFRYAAGLPSMMSRISSALVPCRQKNR